MGVSSTTNRLAYVGDGATTTFSFPYYFFAQTDLVVYLYDTVAGTATLKTISTHYTITGSVNAQGLYQSGGSVVFITAPTATQRVVIFRSPAQTQNFAAAQNGVISSTAIVQQLDYLTLLAQRLEDQVARSAIQSDGMGATFSNTLPTTLSLNPGAALIVNSGGTGWDVGPTATSITGAATSAAAALASQVAAASSATSASTSASNAATSATASATSATASATSATAASTSQTAAATSATNASTSATAAAGSATSASTSATNAATSATGAATSATNAATSETNAAGSATAAAGSATSAATSAASIAASTSTPTANTVSKWDANVNMSAVNFNAGLTNTVNSGATTTLTNASTGYQVFSTGGAGNTVVLPVASTCTVGQSFCIYNPSGTGVTVNSSGANLVQTMLTGSRMIVTCLTASGTGAASWIVKYQTQLSAVPAAITTTQWDARKCLTAQVFIPQSTTTATAAGTTTLDVNSTQHLYFTGVTTQTVVLATASVLVNGYNFYIYNLSTGVVTVQTSGGNTVQAMAANTQLMITCINTAGGTGTASWAWTYLPITGVVPSTKGDLPTFSTVPAKIGVGANGQALVADSTAATGLKWGSVGGGSKNYLSTLTASTASGVANTGNGDLELGATTGWSLGTATLTSNFPTGVPTFGSGASGNLSISAVSSSQLAGLYSLSYASSAATTAGNFVASSAFFIDLEDQAKVLTFKFAYSGVTSPTNVNWSGTSANSFGVAIYDVTNSAWIQPAGVFNLTQSSGVGISTGTFQTTSNSTQYRLVVYNANATAGAATLYFDDFTVSPQTTPIGPVMTDWVSYTPTIVGFGTPTSVSFFSRRVGDTLQGHGTFTSGTPTAVPATFTIGYNGGNANISLDTAKFASIAVLGNAETNTANATSFNWTVVYNSSATALGIGYQASGSQSTVAQNGNGISVSNGGVITLYFEVPIVGWSSNTSLSSDTDTRVVAFSNSGQTPTGTLNSSYNTITYISAGTIVDTHGSYDNAGTYTIPISGNYVVSAGFGMSGTSSVNADNAIGVHQNGTIVFQGNVKGQVVGGIFFNPIVSGILKCKAGDLITVKSVTTSTAVSYGGGTSNFVSINRLSGPAVVQATESVNMNYTDTSGGAIGTGTTTYTLTSKNFDSHNAYSGGTYTIPVSGKYRVTASLLTAAVTFTTAQNLIVAIYKNGTQIAGAITWGNGGSNINYMASPMITSNCVAGDAITIKTISSVATTGITSPAYNNLSIERIGN